MALSFNELLTAVPLVLRAGNVPSIVGEAGIGKSTLVARIAEQMQAQLFTTVVSLSEKGDLAIPVPPLTESAFVQTNQYGELADVKYGYTHTLIEIIQAAEQHPGQPIIWFLDEFNRGSQAVQSELMNLVLQRQINTLSLPNEVHLVIAENPDDTMAGFENANYGVVAGDAAIKDRTVRLVMKVDVSDWLAWAQGNDTTNDRQMVHPLVQQYIAEDATRLYPVQRGADLNPTPRAWQRLSDNLYELAQLDNADLWQQLLFDLAAGDLGDIAAQDFVHFVQRQQQAQITVQDLFANDMQVEFKELPEVEKVGLLKAAHYQLDLAQPELAAKYTNYLQLVAKDGQYALVKDLAIGNLLERLYEQTDSAVQTLYDLITEVASYGQRGR